MSFGTKAKGDKGEPAWANLIEDALGDGNPAQSAAYVVFLDGSTYKARNGTDGTIDYSGTNAATVINAAIDACPDYGTVYAKAAMTLTEQITVDRLKSFMFDRIIISDTDDDGIVVDGGASAQHMKNFVIGKFVRFPENYAKSAIKLRNTLDVFLQIPHIYVNTGLGAANSVGIHLIGDGTGCYFNHVKAGVIGAIETGIQLESVGGTDFCNANKIYDADINYCVDGVKQVNGGTAVAGNSFSNLTVNGIGNGDTGFTNVGGDNTYFGCRTIDATGTSVDFNNSGTAYLFGCQFSNSSVTNTGTIQHHACHFGSTGKLENGGITGAIATGATVAHGLATTPTVIIVTAAESGPTDIYADTVGATTFKINYGGGGTKTFYWRAKKEF